MKAELDGQTVYRCKDGRKWRCQERVFLSTFSLNSQGIIHVDECIYMAGNYEKVQDLRW